MKSFAEMTRLEKALLVGLGLLLVGWFAWPTFHGWFLQPLAERRTEITSREATVATREREKRQTVFDERSLALWTALSLPPEPLDAQRLYQTWLTRQAAAAGFRAPKIVPHKARVPHRGVYTTVAVDVEAEATFEQLVRFLFLVQRTSLMHRVAVIDAEATGRHPNDPIELRLTAEGICLTDAKPRSRLFPTTTLVEELPASADTLVVERTDGFPTDPGFEVRIGSEFLTVTAVKGDTWTVERGRHGSQPTVHAAASDVELVPVLSAWRERSLEDFRTLVSHSPFAEPRTYEPNVSPVGTRDLVRGESLKFRVNASGHDPAGGEPTFELLEGAEVGMQIDPKTGEFTWNPAESAEPGAYPAKLAVHFPRPEATREVAFDVRLRNPTPEGVDPRENPARLTHLVGTLERDGERLAWLYNRSSDVKTELGEGRPVSVPGLEGFVLAIGKDFVLVQVDEETWRLDLGRPLSEMTSEDAAQGEAAFREESTSGS